MMRVSDLMAFEIAGRFTGTHHYRRHLCCIQNLSHGHLDWEADLVVVHDTGYLTEIEIKITMTDWKNDHKKAKWCNARGLNKIRNFYYAVTPKLWARCCEIVMPPGAGVIVVDLNAERIHDRCRVVDKARPNPDAEKLDTEGQIKLLRLASMRAWSHMEKRIQQNKICIDLPPPKIEDLAILKD